MATVVGRAPATRLHHPKALVEVDEHEGWRRLGVALAHDAWWRRRCPVPGDLPLEGRAPVTGLHEARREDGRSVGRDLVGQLAARGVFGEDCCWREGRRLGRRRLAARWTPLG